MKHFNFSTWFHRKLTKISIYFVLLISCIAIVLFFIWKCSSEDNQLINTFYFFGINFPNKPSCNTLVYLLIGICGVLIFNGLLIAACSSGVERYVERIREGRKRFRLKDHFVMIGYNNYSSSVIENTLRSNDNKLIILTSANPTMVRSKIRASLPKNIDKRVIIYAGDGNTSEHIKKINLEYANKVFIMTEGNEWENQYTQSMSLLKEVALFAGKRSFEDNTLLPVNVFINEIAAFDLVQRLDIPKNYYGTNDKNGDYYQNLDLHILNFHDNWARLLWSFNGKKENGKYFYDALDFEPIENTNKYVHLVVVGFNQMGRALVNEAIRICHYPNYNEKTDENKTIITIVDPLCEKLEEQWKAQYPYCSQIKDIDIEFRSKPVEDSNIRDDIKQWAQDERQMLTIVICISDPDTSMNMALTLPEVVYFHNEKGNSLVDSNLFTPSRVRILVRQNIKKSLHEIIGQNKHYSNVKLFGSFLDGFDNSFLDDNLSICVNGIFDEYYENMKKKNFSVTIIYELQQVLNNFNDPECARKKYEEWKVRWQNQNPDNGTSESKKLATRLQIDHYRTLLSILERNKKSDNEDLLKEELAHTEHRRWIAERSMAGWRQVCDGEIRDNDLRIHTCLKPHAELPEEELIKDVNVVTFAESLVEFVKTLKENE